MVSAEPIVVLISADADTRSLARDSLDHGLPHARLHVVDSIDEIDAVLDGSTPDLVVFDSRTATQHDAALKQLHTHVPAAPIIVLADPTAATIALNDGATDVIRITDLSTAKLAHAVRRCVRRRPDTAFRTIVSTIADAIVIVDEHGITRFVNPAAERLFGRPGIDLVGQEFGFPLVTGESTDVEILHPRHGPVYAELRVSDSEWQDQSARVAVIRDVTERRRAEQRDRQLIREQALRAAAEQSERRARFLGEASNILAAAFDNDAAFQQLAELSVPFIADWCIIDVLRDDGTFRRAGIATASGRGASLARRIADTPPRIDAGSGAARVLRLAGPQLAVDATAPAVAGVLGTDTDDDDLAAAGIGACMVLPLITRDRPIGIMTFCDADSGRLFDDDDLDFAGELAGRTAVAIDNARLLADAREANQAKADFLAVMSHELRTPLNAIIGYADLLIMGVPASIPDVSVEQARRVRASARHLLNLIEEILTYSRFEAGREELYLDDVVIDDIVADTASLIEPIAAAAGITFTVNCLDDGVWMRTDTQKLRQILVNLLSNAVKFTGSGGVTFTVAAGPNLVEFCVADTGAGIAPADVDRIFDPFWQVEPSRTRSTGGTGLGLAVARRLAHLLGGEIFVHSTLGQGSTFTLRVPLAPPTTHADAIGA